MALGKWKNVCILGKGVADTKLQDHRSTTVQDRVKGGKALGIVPVKL